MGPNTPLYPITITYCFISQYLCYVSYFVHIHILWFARFRASKFSNLLAPRATGPTSPMSRPEVGLLRYDMQFYSNGGFHTSDSVPGPWITFLYPVRVTLRYYFTFYSTMNVVQLPNKVTSFMIYQSFIHSLASAFIWRQLTMLIAENELRGRGRNKPKLPLVRRISDMLKTTCPPTCPLVQVLVHFVGHNENIIIYCTAHIKYSIHTCA